MSDAEIIDRRLRPDDVPYSEEFFELPDREIDSYGRAVFEKDIDNVTRKTLRRHARLVECGERQVVIRKGDWGNSAFFILDGEIGVVIEQEGNVLSNRQLGRLTVKRKSLFSAIMASFWRRREPEFRDVSTAQNEAEMAKPMYIQDFPGVFDPKKTKVMGKGELFGELAALGRTQRVATVFAASKAQLLEIRWQGLRDLRKRDSEFKDRIDEVFRTRALAAFVRDSEFFEALSDLTLVDDKKKEALLDELKEQADLLEVGEFDTVGGFRQQQESEIAKEDDYPNGVFLIRSGVAKLSKRHHDGQQTLSYLTPGKMFGFEEVVEGWTNYKQVPLRHSLSALGYLTAVFLPTRSIEKFLERPNQNSGEEPTLQPAPEAVSSEKPPLDPETMDFLVEKGFVNATQSMVINLDRCTRCDDCVRACADGHDNNPRFLRQGPIHNNFMVAHACMHCRDPVCMIECPTGAISRQIEGSSKGVVTINDPTCIGCAQCANNCPYDAIRMVEIRNSSGRMIRTSDNHTIFKATKCDLCVGQFGGPACQRACPHDALVRMDMGNANTLADWFER